MTDSIVTLFHHLENTAAWIVLICAAAAVCGGIWAFVDTCVTYRAKWSYLTRAAGPSTVRKPVQSNLVHFRSNRVH